MATRELAARWWGLPAPVDSDSDGLVSLAEFAAAMLRQDPLALDGAAGTRPAGLGGAASDAAAADRIWELLLVLREEVDPLGTRRDLPDMERLRRAAAAGTLADRDVYDCLDGLAAAWRAQGLDFPVALSRAALAPPAPDPAYPPPPGAQPPPP